MRPVSATETTVITLETPADDAAAVASRIGPISALLGGAVAIGFAPIFAKIAMHQGGFGASATGFWRIGLSVPILLSFWGVLEVLGSRKSAVMSTTKAIPIRLRRHWFALLMPGLIFGGDIAVWHFSFHYTTAAAATLLANCQVVLVGLVSWLILRERLRWQYPLGAALALVGIALLLLNGGEPLVAGRNPLIGNLLGLLTACFYASYIISVQFVRRFFSTLTVLVWVSVVSALVLLVVALASGEQIWEATPVGWWSVLALAVVPHCMGQGLIVYALAKLPASFTSVTLLIQPVMAGIWGWLILGELLTGVQITAGVIVLIGIYFARRGSI